MGQPQEAIKMQVKAMENIKTRLGMYWKEKTILLAEIFIVGFIITINALGQGLKIPLSLTYSSESSTDQEDREVGLSSYLPSAPPAEDIDEFHEAKEMTANNVSRYLPSAPPAEEVFKEMDKEAKEMLANDIDTVKPKLDWKEKMLVLFEILFVVFIISAVVYLIVRHNLEMGAEDYVATLTNEDGELKEIVKMVGARKNVNLRKIFLN